MRSAAAAAAANSAHLSGRSPLRTRSGEGFAVGIAAVLHRENLEIHLY
jgi:hypothetical protein